MWQNIITAVTAILALVVGVLIEPFKNAFAHKARARQLRAERCEEFVAAVSNLAVTSAVTAMKVSGLYPPVYPMKNPEAAREVIEDRKLATDRANTLALTLHLYGPDDLGKAAMGAATKASLVGWKKNPAGMSVDDLTVQIEITRAEFNKSITHFIDVARKHISR